MKNSLLYLILSFVLILSACYSGSQPEIKAPVASTHLGEIHFKTTGAEEAKPFFEKGLLLLHSFEYEDAREEFLKAQEIDSTFAMAFWGEAMTYHHSLWQKQEQDKGLAALNKLAPTTEARLAYVKTDLEKDFLKAIENLFGEGTKYERDLAYKNQMEQLTAKYPENHEVAAFYAISLLGASRNGRDEELYGKSARIAQGIIKENPNHPGALHYLIHSYDDPEHAHMAKAAADKYSKVAPDAAHALHMPSHIYVALGSWNNVVESNIASWNASVKRLEKKNIKGKDKSYHALNWLQYGFLERGEVESATMLLQRMKNYATETSTKVARSYLVAMKGAHLVETNDWTSEWANIEVAIEDLNLTKKAGYYFIEGMKAYHQKDKEQLNAMIKEIKTDRDVAKFNLGDKGFSMCSTAGFANKPPNQLDVDMVHIMEMELMAYLATLNGDKKTAAQLFEEATTLDEDLKYSFGPPLILKPVHEAYGEWLLENNQVEKALTVFDQSLNRYPRRLRSLKGKKAAAALLNKENVVAAVEEELTISLSKKERAGIL
ncbi:MAG: tetratricopeptide (TPR) repeat protein [Polaribacter sp.]|jgi:tetratricopeptide (TPR) repeat protein